MLKLSTFRQARKSLYTPRGTLLSGKRSHTITSSPLKKRRSPVCVEPIIAGALSINIICIFFQRGHCHIYISFSTWHLRVMNLHSDVQYYLKNKEYTKPIILLILFLKDIWGSWSCMLHFWVWEVCACVRVVWLSMSMLSGVWIQFSWQDYWGCKYNNVFGGPFLRKSTQA